jgi:hypothetical protein
MIDANAALAAMRALTEASDDEVAQSHAQFLAAAARAGFEIPAASDDSPTAH